MLFADAGSIRIQSLQAFGKKKRVLAIAEQLTASDSNFLKGFVYQHQHCQLSIVSVKVSKG